MTAFGHCAVAFLLGPCMLAAVGGQTLRPLQPLRALNDEVGVLSIDEASTLVRSLEQIFDRTGVRVVMVIAETTEPEPVEDYAQRLAERWERERQLDIYRSVFVVLSLNGRELQLLPGSALSARLPELAAPGMAQGLTPLLRRGRYFEALMKLNGRLLEVIRKHHSGTVIPPGHEWVETHCERRAKRT